MDQATKDALAHYHVIAVPTEGGGGGAGPKGTAAGPNIQDLLAELKGKRALASVAGLKKSLNGDPIGVAADNIFKQVSRRYQYKISTHTFN
jgi:hypothetical protein